VELCVRLYNAQSSSRIVCPHLFLGLDPPVSFCVAGGVSRGTALEAHGMWGSRPAALSRENVSYFGIEARTFVGNSHISG
jgi:hypothetical protein